MKKIYIYYLSKKVSEGGMARNAAFLKYCNTADLRINVFRSNRVDRLLITIKILIRLILSNGESIFIHQGALLYCFPPVLLKFKLFNIFFSKFIRRISLRNKFTIEVNDLQYEQSKDLGLVVNQYDFTLQKILFSNPNIRFVFASVLMKDYVILKYGANKNNCDAIVNGTIKLKDLDKDYDFFEPNDDRIKFIYCGTLNYGRGISNLIEIFQNNSNAVLYLMGTNGEWLKNFEFAASIKYIGSFEEEEAMYIASKCDVGVLHYDENKLYYNICFPTKASFYLGAGLPVLSTPISELLHNFEDIFIFSQLDRFATKLNEINKSDLVVHEKKVCDIQHLFYWETLLKEFLYF
ncbi:hypothetical protein [Empedobacter falsenii]